MKTRRALLATTLAIVATVVCNTAAANTETAQNEFANIAKSYVDTAVAETVYELHVTVATDVLTASHHFEPQIDVTRLLAAVNITDIENEG